MIVCQKDFKDIQEKFQKLGKDYSELKSIVENDQGDENKIILQLRSQVDSLNGSLAEKEKVYKERTEELMAAQNDFKEIQSHLATLNGINNECVEANTKLKSATEANLKYLNEISNLKEQLKSISHLYDEKSQELIKLHCNKINVVSRESQKNLELMNQQLNDTQTKLKCNEVLFKLKNDKISSLEIANSTLIEKLRSKNNIQEINVKHITVVEKEKEYERQISNLKLQLKNLEKDNSILKETSEANVNFESAIQEVNERYRLVSDQKNNYEMQLSELESQVEVLTSKYNQSCQSHALAEEERKKVNELLEKNASALEQERVKLEETRLEKIDLKDKLDAMAEKFHTKSACRVDKEVQTKIAAKIGSNLSSKCDKSSKGKLRSVYYVMVKMSEKKCTVVKVKFYDISNFQ